MDRGLMTSHQSAKITCSNILFPKDQHPLISHKCPFLDTERGQLPSSIGATKFNYAVSSGVSMEVIPIWGERMAVFQSRTRL